jgi:hypothetical protein
VTQPRLPGVLKKRELHNDPKAAPAEMKALAQSLAEAEYLSDAIDFFRKSGDQDGLAGLVDRVAAEGDYFLAVKIEQALGRPLDGGVWQRVAETARALGKQTFAARAQARIEEPKTDG